MATYIQGLTGYVPQVQPFRPDYGFYNQVLQFKQNQYDTNYKQLSNLYGSLLNSPLSRSNNIEKRDKFFTEIKDSIQKISRMDLSLQQNVQAASKVFNGLLDDEGIKKDMIWTKNFYKQMDRAEAFKLCTDSDECNGKYWEEGVADLQYQLKAFQEASPEEALRFGNVSYVPGQDLTGDAMKWVKEMDISIKQDNLSPDGRYIVTSKNGPMSLDYFNSLLTSKFGNDQKYKDAFRVKERVSAKSWIYNSIDSGEYSSYADAENAYITMQSDYINDMFKSLDLDKKEEKDLNRTTNQIEIHKKKAEETKSSGGSFLEREIERLEGKREVLESSLQSRKETLDDTERYFNNPGSLDQLVNVLAGLNMKNSIYQTAGFTSMMNSEQTLREDKFALEKDKFRYSMALESAKHKNQLEQIAQKHMNSLELEAFKSVLKTKEDKKSKEGTAEDNTPYYTDELNSDVDTNFDKVSKGIEESILKNTGEHTVDVINGLSRAMRNDSFTNEGETDATSSYAELMNNIQKQMKAEGIDPNTVSEIREYNALGSDVKNLRNYMQKYNLGDIAKKANLTNQSYLNIYNEFIDPFVNQAPDSQRNTGYLKSFVQNDQNKALMADLKGRKDAHVNYQEAQKRIEAEAIKQAAASDPSLTQAYQNRQKVQAMSKQEYFQKNPTFSRIAEASLSMVIGTGRTIDLRKELGDSEYNAYISKVKDIMYENRMSPEKIEKGIEGVISELKKDNKPIFTLADGLAMSNILLAPGLATSSIVNSISNALSQDRRRDSNFELQKIIFNLSGDGDNELTKSQANDINSRNSGGIVGRYVGVKSNLMTDEQLNKIVTDKGSTEWVNALLHASGGFGSKQGQSMNFSTADPSMESVPSTLVRSFLADASNQASGNSFTKAENIGASIREKDRVNDDNAVQILKYIQSSFNSRVEDKSRPKLSLKYMDDVYDGEYVALKMDILNPGDIASSLGKEKEEVPSSIVTYIKKNSANNEFRKYYDQTPMEALLSYSKVYEFDNYQDVAPGLKMYQDEPGTYRVTGNVMRWENGEPIMREFSSKTSNPDDARIEIESLLRRARQQLNNQIRIH